MALQEPRDIVTDRLLELLFEHEGAGLCVVGPDGSVLRANAEWLRSGKGLVLTARAASGTAPEKDRWVGALGAESEVFLRKVIDATPSMVFVKDFDGRFVLGNDALGQCYGRPVQELVGKTDADFNSNAEEVANFLRDDRDVMTTRRPKLIAEEPVTQGDGKVRWFSTVKVPLVNDDGSCDKVLGVATDITDRKRAEEALRRSEERFRKLLESSMLGLAIGDETGGLTYVNDALLRLIGYGREDVLSGRLRWDALTPAEHLPLDARAIAELHEHGRTEPYEKAYVTKDGRRVPILVGVVPIERTATGHLVLAAYVVDLSSRKRVEQELQESEARFRTLADNAPDVIARFDHAMRHVYMNRAAEAVTGVPAERFLGKTSRQLGMPAPLVATWEAHIRRVLEGGAPVTMEFELTKSGAASPAHYEARLVPERAADGSVQSVLCLARDMTERRRMEQALREADQRKDEFLATLSHELRNPLAAITSAAGVIRHRLACGQDVERPLEVLERQIRNSARLLDDLLDVARITRGVMQLKKTPVLVETVVRSALDSQAALIESARHALTVELPAEPVVVDADPTRLEQIVSNLLNNAAKYTPAGGRIAVSVERRDREVGIHVKDSGHGIPPALLPRVFDLFVQAEQSLARSQGGLGLGLTLVKKLAELHGGTVEARSEGPGKGSEFIVRLPARVTAEPPAAPAAATGPPRARRILLVEDNYDSAELLAEFLASLGHDVAVAHDGPAALDAAARVHPEIVLLDIGLPGMDGYEVGRRLRASDPQAPVLVALTGYGQEEDRSRSRNAGFAHHLTKPFEPAALERLLAGLGPRH